MQLYNRIVGDVLEHDATSRPDGDMGNIYSLHDDSGTTRVSIYEASSELSTDTSGPASIGMSWVMAYESSNEVPNITSFEKSHDVSTVVSNEFSFVAQCKISNEVSSAALFEVSNVVEGVTSNATSNEVSNEASNEVSTASSCEALNKVSTDASYDASNEVSTEVLCKASNEVSTEASCEESNEVSTEASCEASNVVSIGASCGTSNQLSTEASCEASNEVSTEASCPADVNSQEFPHPEIVTNPSKKVHNNIDLKIDIGKTRPIEGSRNVEVFSEGSIHCYPASDFWNESEEFEIQFDVSSAEEFFKSGNSEEDESTYVVTPGGQIMSYSFDLESGGSENLFNENLPDLKCCSVEFATKTTEDGISEPDSNEEIAELQRNSTTTSESRGFWISEGSSVVTPERDINRVSTEVNNNSERVISSNNGIEGVAQIQPNLKGVCVLLTDEDIRVMLRGSSHQDLESWSGSFDGKD